MTDSSLLPKKVTSQLGNDIAVNHNYPIQDLSWKRINSIHLFIYFHLLPSTTKYICTRILQFLKRQKKKGIGTKCWVLQTFVIDYAVCFPYYFHYNLKKNLKISSLKLYQINKLIFKL